MKIINWKTLIITCIVCLLPILLGIALWDILPDTMAIHFNMYNEADNFASKEFVVFCMPLIMVACQIISCLINDINEHKHGKRTKFGTVTKWIIPILTIILQILTFGYSLGWNVDIRKFVALIIGIMFIIMGNYMPKLDYVKNHKIDTEKARKVNRIIGYETVIMGILILLTIFMPPIATIIWFILFIPYTVVAIVYSVKISKNNSDFLQ